MPLDHGTLRCNWAALENIDTDTNLGSRLGLFDARESSSTIVGCGHVNPFASLDPLPYLSQVILHWCWIKTFDLELRHRSVQDALYLGIIKEKRQLQSPRHDVFFLSFFTNQPLFLLFFDPLALYHQSHSLQHQVNSPWLTRADILEDFNWDKKREGQDKSQAVPPPSRNTILYCDLLHLHPLLQSML